MGYLAFKDLQVGERFAFAGEYGHDYSWWHNTKTGERTYETQRWKDGSGGEEHRVGVGDQPVVRRL